MLSKKMEKIIVINLYFFLGQLIMIKERLAFMPRRVGLPKREQRGVEISF